ncbi:putative trans-sialidase, Group I, partial [Trypanosoma cruzi]
MSRRLLNSAALLLLFVLFCRGVDASGGAGEQMESKEVELFKPGEVTVPAAEEGRETFDGYSLVLSIHGHSLVDVNGAMLALAIGEYDESYGDMYYNILAKYNSYGDVSNLEKDVTWAAKQWTPKNVFEQFKKGGYRTFLFGPKAVAKANKIFLLLSNFTGQSSVPLQTSYSWDLELFVGEITASTAVPGGKTVSWEGPRSLKSTLLTLMGKHSWNVLEAARGARGIAVGGTTVVFPLVAVSEKAEKRERTCTVIYSEDDGDTWTFPDAAAIANECRDFTLLEWQGKLLMVTSGSVIPWQLRVYESVDMGKTWAKMVGPFPRLLSQLRLFPMHPRGTDIITATIGSKSVLLYTQMLFEYVPGDTQGARRVMHLFLSDFVRAHDVGPIFAGSFDPSPFITLLHKKGELFALYAKYGEDGASGGLFFTRLTEQMRQINFLLQTWEAVDDRVSTLCSSSAGKSASKDAACVGRLPTDGLVAFFSDNGNSTHWNDEYGGVGATVSEKGVKKVYNGFELTGVDAHILWPAGSNYNNAMYSPRYEELTVVATVTINEAPEKITPLLGVSVAGSTWRKLNLWYDEHKYWRTEAGEGKGAGTIAWEAGKAYRVVLTVRNGECTAYVDGQLLGSLVEKHPFTLGAPPRAGVPAQEKIPEMVSQIFFGSDGINLEGTVGCFTVRNVLLYSRCFNDSEVAALEKREDSESSGAADTDSAKGKATGSSAGEDSESSGAAGTDSAKGKATGSSAGEDSESWGAAGTDSAKGKATGSSAGEDSESSGAAGTDSAKGKATGSSAGEDSESSGAAGTDSAKGKATGSSAGEEVGRGGAAAADPKNTSVPITKGVGSTVMKGAVSGDSTVRGHLCGVLSLLLLLLGLWGVAA